MISGIAKIVVVSCLLLFSPGLTRAQNNVYNVYFRTVSGEPSRFVTAESGCGPTLNSKSKSLNDQVYFQLVDIDGGSLEDTDKVNISCNGRLWRAVNGGGAGVMIDPTIKDSSAAFKIVKANDKPFFSGSWIRLQAENGQFVTAPSDGGPLTAKSTTEQSTDVLDLLPRLGYSLGPEIWGTGPYQGPPGFDRGMQATMHCGNDPESWVRGSAQFNKSSGVLRITMQLETDSVIAGPKGLVVVTLKDANNATLATATTGEKEMGGKPPGKAVIRYLSATAVVSEDEAKKASFLFVQPQCTGSKFGPGGLDKDVWEKAFEIVVAVVAGG